MTDEYRFGPCMVCNKPSSALPSQNLCCSDQCRENMHTRLQWFHDLIEPHTVPIPTPGALTREVWRAMLEAKRKRGPGPRKHVSYHHINQVLYAPEDVVVTWDGVPLEDVVTTEPEPDNG